MASSINIYTVLIIASCLMALIVSESPKMSLKREISLDFNFKILNRKSYGTVDLSIAADMTNTSFGFEVPMIPDLSDDNVFVGFDENLNWGIDCEQGNLCTLIRDTEKTCSRMSLPSSQAQCQQAETYIRFRDQKVDNDTQRVKLWIMYDDNKWYPKSAGILGLSPKSLVWDYINQAFDNELSYIDISFFYRVNDIEKLYKLGDKTYKNAILAINGNGIATQPPMYNITMNQTHWVIDSAEVQLKASDKAVQMGVCISNTINYTFAVNNYDSFKQQFFTQLCGKTDACKRVESRVNFVDDVKVEFYNASYIGETSEITTLVLTAEEMFYYDEDGNAVLLFGDLSKMTDLCGTQAGFALGLMAFGKREVVFRYWGNGVMQIGFQEFHPTALYLWILISLAVIMALTFVAICVLSTYSRVSDGEGAQDGENQKRVKDQIEEEDDEQRAMQSSGDGGYHTEQAKSELRPEPDFIPGVGHNLPENEEPLMNEEGQGMSYDEFGDQTAEVGGGSALN